MGLNRRQFLVWSGMGGSLALAARWGRLQNRGDAAVPRSTSPSTQRNLAPPGLYAPLQGDVRLVVISDLNSAYGSTTYESEVTQAIALIPQWQPNLVLGGGDMVAGQKQSLTPAQIQAMWSAFDQAVAAPLRRAQLPFGFTIGNHDGSGALSQSGTPLFARERELAAAYWNNPRHNPGLAFVDRAQFPFYYTFADNNVFYLVWDASTARIAPQQLAWVEKSLGSSVAQGAKLRIVIGHLPLYGIAVGRDKPGEVLDRSEQLRSLLERYRVHTYISGHQHAYYPGHRGKLELLHAGALGGGPRRLLGSEGSPQKTLTVVDIYLNRETTTYTTYDMATLKVIDQKQLPRLIVGHNGTVLRRDLTEKDLSAAERAQL
jgi:hypothetical protein